MKQKNQLTNLVVSMTSLEIAEMTGKRHSDVVYDINLMFTVLNLQGADFSVAYKMPSGQKTTVYNLPKRETLILVSGYSIELRTKIIDRLDYLEKENLQLRNDLQLKEKARQDARMEYKPMSTALEETRKLLGKDTQHYHYSNEANLINIIVMGSTAKKLKEDWGLDSLDNLRDELTPQQIAAVQDLQKVNTSLIDVGLDYDERKEKLNILFNRKWSMILIEEHIKITA